MERLRPQSHPWTMLHKALLMASAASVTSIALAATDPPAQRPKGQLLPLPNPQSPPTAAQPPSQAQMRTGAITTASALASSVLLFEDFESLAPGWIPNGSWEIGQPLAGPSTGAGSARAAGTDLAADYPPNAADALLSPIVTLPTLGANDELTLSFDEWFQLESGYDRGSVQVSTDSGANWTTLSTRDGDQPTYRQTRVPLDDYAGQSLQLRFVLSSDSNAQFPGWFVDNVRIAVETAQPVEVGLPTINAQNFPFVFLDATVRDDTNVCPAEIETIDVLEDGVVQTITITPPNEGGGSRLVDIVFVIDNSGSMGDEQASVVANIEDFVDTLTAAGVDAALGLTRYGGVTQIEEGGNLTTDAEFFKNEVLSRNVTSAGGFEPGYEALSSTSARFTFRPGSQRVVIIVTDETPAQGPFSVMDADLALKAANATLFAVVRENLFSDFEPLVEDPASQLINILSPFDEVVDFISDIVANTYRISYRSTNDIRDGMERHVLVEVSCGSETGQAEGAYSPGAEPTIRRTQPTIDLAGSGQMAGVDLPIEVVVEDLVEPLVTDVSLFYRTFGEPTYTQLPMTLAGGDAGSGTYDASIPAAAVLDPGVEYYISATDGEVTTSSPKTNPGASPYQIAVLPNEPPTLDHTPVTNALEASVVEITAQAADTTNVLDEVGLYFRRSGTLTYMAVPMSAIGGDVYRASIPAEDVTAAGVEYYVTAVDDLGVTSTVGTADEPLTIAVGDLLPPEEKACDLTANGRFSFLDNLAYRATCSADPTRPVCDRNDDGQFTPVDRALFVAGCRLRQVEDRIGANIEPNS